MTPFSIFLESFIMPLLAIGLVAVILGANISTDLNRIGAAALLVLMAFILSGIIHQIDIKSDGDQQ